MESRPVTAPPVPLDEQPSIHARRWFLLAIMCLSLVLVVMTVAGLNTALPTIQRDLGASASDLQWIVDAYSIVFAGLLLSAGAIGDRFGRRHALLGGLAVFGIGTLVGGLATASTQLIAGRAVMGVGAAFIMRRRFRSSRRSSRLRSARARSRSGPASLARARRSALSSLAGCWKGSGGGRRYS
jgi:MFS family permease